MPTLNHAQKSPSSHELVATGIEGLDRVLLGGLLRAGFYLIQGDPGSGKTTLALQFIQTRMNAGERCLYVTLTETRRDLENTCRSHGWSLSGIDLQDLTRSASFTQNRNDTSVFHPADTELTEITNAVIAEVERVQPQNVVFDGLSELRLLSGDPLRYRRQLLSMKDFFESRGITVLLLDDRNASFSEFQPESLMGGNVVLERYLPTYGRARRRLFVTKVRGSHFREGYHDYEILTGGVTVHPRLVAGDHHEDFMTQLCSSGIPNLDAMLCGGLNRGSTTLLLGPAGAGKSTISLQFVVNALRRGKKAAVYVFDEVMHILIDRSEKLCFGKPGGFTAYMREGTLHAQQVDPAEMSPGAFAHEVRRAVNEGAEIVVIDSLNGYLNAMPEERYLTTHLHELFAYLNQKGVLTIIVVAQHGMIASGSNQADVDVSYLADSVILFRYYEAAGEIHQALSVFKKRTGPHERTIRQLVIDQNGLTVGEPLRQFRGIMTGVPLYDTPRPGSRADAGGARSGNENP
ncbi:MAG TPA: ATPase domain-containing protein [Polyangiaceae bacterium]|jgi:circadian clock protein KaiC|nr:ATPase domain-containing protein [Polyangiaceae bacterium]